MIGSGAKLSGNNKNIITDLIVDDRSKGGQWRFPLNGGIDLVNDSDFEFATKSAADIKLIDTPDNGKQIEVLYTGVDDETRRATVDLTIDPIFTSDQTTQQV